MFMIIFKCDWIVISHIPSIIYLIRYMEAKPKVAEQVLANIRAHRRNLRRHNMLKDFKLDIAPNKYKGMHFFGNFKDKNNRSTLNDPKVNVLPLELIINKTVLDLGAGDASITI